MGCVCCGGASEAEKAIRTGIDSFVGAIVEVEIEAKGDLLGDNVPDETDFDADGKVTVNHTSMNDYLFGNSGEDTLIDQFGSDGLIGGQGNDLIISMSDSNIPQENQTIPANVDDGDDLARLNFYDIAIEVKVRTLT